MTPSTPTDDVLLHGEVKASYFWDDGSGINGDTGPPASGKPMQKGLFAAPSWPLGTKGYVVYEGKTAEFFIGDRGPGDPSQGCHVMLDIDGKTFAELTGESWNETTYTVTGGAGHINVEYYITEWGDGPGTPGVPHPFQNPSEPCHNAVSPIPESQESAPEEASSEETPEESAEQQSDTEQAAPAEQEEETAEAQAAPPSPGSGTPSDSQQADAPAPAADDAAAAEQTTTATETGHGAFDLMSTEGPMTSAGLTIVLLIAAGAAVTKRVASLLRPTGRHHRAS